MNITKKSVIAALLASLLCFLHISYAQEQKPLSFTDYPGPVGVKVMNKKVAITVTITRSPAGDPIFSERHLTVTDSMGQYHINIGRGSVKSGAYDSIIWSDGNYYLNLDADTSGGTTVHFRKAHLLRMPVDLGKEHEQGTVEAAEYPTYGSWRIPNSKGRRPKLVTVDLTTSYANTAYPKNTYPIYRHFEWADPDLDGVGNAFMISYSDYTTNQFSPSTKKLGEVSLYSLPFQEIILTSTAQEIAISMTKPVAVTNLSETYALKGPWKFIYYIEW